jgi:3-oxoadipate enol-lactonase
MPQLSLVDCQLNYQIHGDAGHWVTLVNGHTRSLRDFRLFAKKLVSSGFRVLTFDNRGAGETLSRTDFSFDDMAEDVRSLWHELDIEQSHLLGISMGGWICQKLASGHQDIIQSLVLVSTSSKILKGSPDDHGWGQTIDSVRNKLKPYFSEEYVLRNKIIVDAMSKQILKNNLSGEFDDMASAQRVAMSQLNLEGLAADIGVPTMIIHGGKDRIIEVAEAQKLESLIPQSKIQIFPQAGHLLLAEASSDLYAMSIEFFRKKI